ncbi:MAG: HIT domain-containing protein, partial [Planctomycetes bacterium]|nr:HIT domain-containing protein [Planctomycetota bacterium]
WAPWRMEYILEVDDPHECFLCQAARSKNEREHFLLWHSENCLALMNRWPYNNGHLLVAPREHLADLEDLSDEGLCEQMSMIKRCRLNLEKAMSPDGYNVGLNLGRSAGAGVEDHLHWHIVPRWHGDTNFMPITAATKVIPQSLEELWEMLREVDEEGD